MSGRTDALWNRAELARSIAAWDAGGNVGLPEHVVPVRPPWICGTGKWLVQLGEQLGCGFDGTGLGYNHFVGEGDTPKAAHEAAIKDMRARTADYANPSNEGGARG